ncbi:MAG: SGNH/GDSL hydrolase family protein [Deltaproteobacteria bacterium]|nr:SGNH/GDSL hydrolase family protein [Deltaproteobacteria bacterium]
MASSEQAPAATPVPEPPASSSGGPAAAADPLPPLPAGTTVLHIGDSMADALGKPLREELAKAGVKTILKVKEATYIPQWASYTMGLPILIKVHRPDLVLVTLGGNEVGMPDPSVRGADVRRLVGYLGDRPCVWIATPLWGQHTGILDVVRDNCHPCRYFDTNARIPDLQRLGDKIHPTIPERRRWARVVLEWLARSRDPSGRRPWDLLPEAPLP